MERDSRRGLDQWRGCHTFNDIICDGDASVSHSPRSGGLMMGHNYYYYYEVDGSIETHDPAAPSTTTCPYLPGQRVNTLWMPVQRHSRQRSASVNSLRRSDFQTMDPDDRFVTPRPAPAKPTGAPAAGPELKSMPSPAKRSLSPMPSSRYLLRHQRSSRSLSPAPSLSTWSPRRLFARRASPSREVTCADDVEQVDEAEPSSSGVGTGAEASAAPVEQSPLLRPVLPSRLVSSSSITSFSSISHLRHAALHSSPASQGSRSRDISPESLRRFLVDDTPLDGTSGNSVSSGVPAAAATTSASRKKAFILAESDDEYDDDRDFDFDDDNFVTSATSDSAPLTILSPPPPSSQSRNVTPVMALQVTPEEVKQELAQDAAPVAQERAQDATPAVQALCSPLFPPKVPTRAPPAIPMVAPPNDPENAESATARTVEVVQSPSRLDQPALSIDVELPPSSSPMSLSPMSSWSSNVSFHSPASHGLTCLALADATDDEGHDAACYTVHGEPSALFLPPPEHPFGAEGGKPDMHQHAKSHRHHLMAAALTGSTATLVPGNERMDGACGTGLGGLVDELGWMATAIHN